MKGLKKGIGLVVSSCFIVSVLLAGCGTPKNSSVNGTADMQKEVTLKWIMGGPGRQEDSQLVWDQFNKKLQEKLPNTKVEFTIIPLSDYAEKWKLMLASNEPMDIVWSGWMLNYAQLVKNGAYLELDELLDKNAPMLRKTLSGWVWDKVKIDNKIYAIPNYQKMASKRGMYAPKELIDKYIDREKFVKVFADNKTMTDEAYNTMEEYLGKLKADGQMQKGVGYFFSLNKKGYEAITNIACIKLDDGVPKVVNWFETPEFKRYIDVKRRWYEKGYIRTDILTAQDARTEDGKKDGSILWVHDIDKSTSEMMTKTKGFPIDTLPLESNFRINNGISATNTALSRNCVDPVRAIKVLELLNTESGKELYNLLVYGIEGNHYTKTPDNKIHLNGSANGNDKTKANTLKYGLTNWIIGNTFNGYELDSSMPGYSAYIEKEVHANAEVSPINGFVFNNEAVKIETAQTEAVISEYETVLSSGALPDYQDMYNQFIEKLKVAHSEQIVAEVQRQLDEWLKNKK